ncbi:MAG TPA: MBL fold metallo-hydrolase [Steroidobacteraceae bacterium]|nr:MBL fold metallo-hydrolase [Steroidobacteraceae bacterium]
MNKSRLAASPLLCALLFTGLVACSDPPPPPAAPPPPPVSQNVRTFSIGAMTGIALHDGGLELPNDNKVLGVGRTPAEVADLLGAAGLPTDKLMLSVQPLLVRAGGRVMLFDTGAGTNMGEGAGKLGAALAEAGVTPDSVTDIFISHLHGDHVGGLIDASGDPVFPNAIIRISEPEWQTLRGLNDRTAASFGLNHHVEIARAIEPAVAPFKPGAELLPGMVRAVEVKGHTPGHSAFRIGTGSNALLYIGDSMHHHVVSVQKPEWPIAFDTDAAQGAASRASLLADLAASNQRVYAVHFPFPGLGRIEKRGEGYAWVAE